MKEAHTHLWQMFESQESIPKKLRAVWALWVTGGLKTGDLLGMTEHKDQNIRAWAVRLLVDGSIVDAAVIKRLAVMAEKDSAAFVRLHLCFCRVVHNGDFRWDSPDALLDRS